MKPGTFSQLSPKAQEVSLAVKEEGFLPVQLQPQGRWTLANLALGLSMKHALCTLPIDGHNDVSRPETGSLSLASLSHLQ